MSVRVAVQAEDFIVADEMAWLEQAGGGAVACFTGIVRGNAAQIVALELETYLPMAEPALRTIAERSHELWPLQAVTLVHRHGLLPVGSRIVFVGAASAHRQAALEACSFLIDWAKTRAPFWKREWTKAGEGQWVEARETDETAASRWDP
jgi:molybdopterin synthase catalytic subunit